MSDFDTDAEKFMKTLTMLFLSNETLSGKSFEAALKNIDKNSIEQYIKHKHRKSNSTSADNLESCLYKLGLFKSIFANNPNNNQRNYDL
ncbi:MAG: hypothetical protein HN590_02365 [Calditrichaeota bacterium]|nr:hypothetical protein [Calditrichota bacterium]MBT7787728.1 hypothetical protein [Calditrichota bacterium]